MSGSPLRRITRSNAGAGRSPGAFIPTGGEGGTAPAASLPPVNASLRTKVENYARSSKSQDATKYLQRVVDKTRETPSWLARTDAERTAITNFLDEHKELLLSEADGVMQSRRAVNGRAFEEAIEGALTGFGVPFLSQHVVDGEGRILGHKHEVGSKGYEIPDIIVGGVVGGTIKDCVVISTKCSQRERGKQDGMLKSLAKKYYLLLCEKPKNRAGKFSAEKEDCYNIYYETRNADAVFREILAGVRVGSGVGALA